MGTNSQKTRKTILEEAREIAPKLKDLRDTVLDRCRRAESEFPKKDGLFDARRSAFVLLLNTLDPLWIHFHLVLTRLGKKEFWDEAAGKRLNQEQIDFSAINFWNMMKLSAIVMLVSAIETSLRRFLRAASPGACSNGNGRLSKVIPTLFKEIHYFNADHSNMLKVITKTRNAIHNNGIHFPPGKQSQSESITWRGKDFVFQPGKPIRLEWELLLEIAEGTFDLLDALVKNEAINALGFISALSPDTKE